MNGRTIADLQAGDRAAVTHAIDEAMIVGFAELAGDRNPVHRDPGFAAATPFGRPIAPGLLTAALVSGVIGSELPGPGTIYLSQSLRFTRPVMAGDRITAHVEVLEVLAERNRVRLQTMCTNQRGEPVLVGEAWVMPPAAATGSAAPRAADLPLAA